MKRKSNMYTWIDDNFNLIKGPCSHDCLYCYMKRFPDLGKLRLDEKLFKMNPQPGRTYFVCSGTDLLQPEVRNEWVRRVIAKLNNHPGCKFLLQTKNSYRLIDFVEEIENHIILCATVESDIQHSGISKAIEPGLRATALGTIKKHFDFTTMITIEPVLEFSSRFIDMITEAHPDIINIGANSRPEVKLPEPSAGDIAGLIEEIKKKLPDTELRLKENLKRLYKK